MDIYVYNKQFELIGVLDSYTSLIWVREYHDIGTVEVHSLINDVSISLLQKGRILVKDNDEREAMYIDNIFMDSKGVETMVARGFAIDNFINDRIVWGTQSYSGTGENIMRQFVNANAVDPSNPSRKIPSLVLGNVNNVGKSGTDVNSYGNLATVTKELAIKYDVGWRVVFDRVNKRYSFEVYTGKDYSIEQSVNPRAIFSAEYENIFDQTYTDSDTTYRNMALVAGAGEATERILLTIGNELSGFDRRELYVDARDLQDKDDEGNPIPNYNSLLNERGITKLAEYTTIRTFESGVSILSNLAYRKDFDLGDKVTIENEKWGISISTTITSVEEIYENNTTDIRVNFGSVIPTMKSILNKAVK